MKLALSSFLGRDVARNRGCSHNFAFCVAQRRHGNGNVEVASVLGYPDRFVIFDGFTTRNFLQDPRDFVGTVTRSQKGYILPDDFFRRVTINALSALVPTGNGA